MKRYLIQISFLLLSCIVSINSPAQGNCVSWNGTSSNAVIDTASEFLCQYGVISSNQNANSVYTSPALKYQVATLLYNSLFGNGASAPSDYFPDPFIDLDLLDTSALKSYKAMLYLDYTDGIPPFPRDYFYTNAQLPFAQKGECLRALLEAWNITPDSTGYNPLSSNASSFYSDVQQNDPNYGWIYKAYELGLCNNLPLNGCTTTCLNSSSPFLLGDVYVMIYRLLMGQTYPTITYNSFFYPNNFSVTNINNQAGVDRAVFSNYEAPSFNIPGGGLPLSFAHSYNSDITELPFMSDEDFYNNVSAQTQAVFPIGVGWTHSYNIFIISIKDYVGGQFQEQKLAIHWADGSIDVYDKLNQAYLTPGVNDNFYISSQNSNNCAQTIDITKPNGIKYHFLLEPTIGILRLDTISDRNNNSVTLSYQNGYAFGSYAPLRLFQVTDNYSNRSLTFNYYPTSNFLQSVTDPIGRTVSFNIDPNANDLLSFTDAKSLTTTYQYDNGSYKHLLETVTRPKGNVTTNTYQQRQLQSSQNDYYNISVNFTPDYLSSSQTSSSSVSVVQSGQTLTTNYEQDTRGNPTHISSQNQDITISYSAAHPDLPEVVRDNLSGMYRQYYYDANGNDTFSSVTASSSATITQLSRFNSYNELTYHVDPNGNITQRIYNNNGNLTLIEEPNNVNTQYTVDANGKVLSKIDPSGITTNYGYNSYGNLNKISYQGLPVSASAVYDGVSIIASITDPKGTVTSYVHDNNDNITDEYFDPSGFNYHTNYYYDSNNNLTNITDPRLLTTTLTYDFNTDDLISESYGNFSRSWSYNTDGTLQNYTTKNNYQFNRIYYPANDNRAGLLQTDGYATYDYDLTTRLLNTITRNGAGYTLTYGYDQFQRTNSISYNDLPGNTVGYNYDNNGNVTQVTYPFNALWQINYEWNSNNRLSGIKDWNNNYLVQYTYRANGQLQTEQFGNGTSTYYSYDTIGRLDSIYTINSNGIILCSVGAYLDTLGRHTRESYFVNLSDTSGLNNYPITIPTSYTYDAMNRLDNTNLDAYTDDNNGNLTYSTTASTTYTWDEKDKLLSIASAMGTKYCEYDPLGNRRKYDTTRFALDILGKGNVLVETDLNGNPKAIYIHGLGLVCRIDVATGAHYYYHYDFRGSTVAISNDTQAVIASYKYEPFGGIIQKKEPSFNNLFAYVGKYGVMHDDTDRYYMRARYYQPSVGRFLGEDPVWSTNLFPYAGNNPLSNTDPNGQFSTNLGIEVSIGADLTFGIEGGISVEFSKENWFALGVYSQFNTGYGEGGGVSLIESVSKENILNNHYSGNQVCGAFGLGACIPISNINSVSVNHTFGKQKPTEELQEGFKEEASVTNYNGIDKRLFSLKRTVGIVGSFLKQIKRFLF